MFPVIGQCQLYTQFSLSPSVSGDEAIYVTVLWVWVDVSVEVDRIDSYKRKSRHFEYIILRPNNFNLDIELSTVFHLSSVLVLFASFACLDLFLLVVS